MINFKRSGKTVEITVDLEVPGMGMRVWTFSWNATSDEYAAFLAEDMRLAMFKRLKVIREKAYEYGWKDVKAKNTKRTWFEGWW